MKLTIAVQGCGHGELDKIYATLQHLEQRDGKKIDLLLCCGDFQATRNLDDLETLACPPKYRGMQTFYKYFSGERVAPYPTIFIGGNHEASNHLWELYYGGWAAPNIYFLGFAGAVRFGGLRIAGLSGIFKPHDYTRGHHESLPYTESTMRSIYHIRDFEVYRLMQLQQPIDIFLSHDWPSDIARYGDTERLMARKPHFRSEYENGTLGSPPAAQLLAAVRPAYWFAAHMHVKFAAVVQHTNQPPPRPSSAAAGSDGARSGSRPGSAAAAAGSSGSGGGSGGGFPTTRFLALDKCLPGRDFIQVVELDAPGPPELHYDEEWLAVLRSTRGLTNLKFPHAPLPGMGGLRTGPKREDVEYVRQMFAARGSTRIPDNFTRTAKPYEPSPGQRRGCMPQVHVRNPQTVALLDMLGLPYDLDHKDIKRPASAAGAGGAAGVATAASGSLGVAAGQTSRPGGRAPLSLTPHAAPLRPRPGYAAAAAAPNPEEIDLGDVDDLGEDEEQEKKAAGAGAQEKRRLADDPMFQPLGL